MNEETKKLARNAIAVQDACNLSGVAIAFAEDICKLREFNPELSSHAINTHPIVRLWISKLADLSGGWIAENEYFADAYLECKENV